MIPRILLANALYPLFSPARRMKTAHKVFFASHLIFRDSPPFELAQYHWATQTTCICSMHTVHAERNASTNRAGFAVIATLCAKYSLHGFVSSHPIDQTTRQIT
jgi:hypothetical protein